MMRFGRNSGARKARYRKRKTQKCHLRFCWTVNNEGHSFRKGAPFKWSKLKPICGISVVKREIAVVFTTAISIFGGLEGDRTLDLCDAKRHIKPFCIISNYLWHFLLSFSFFPPLFRTLISMCYAAVCGAFCGQKRSLPFAGNGFPAWTGSIFRASNCLHCTSDGRIQQVISALSRPQKLGGCKQIKRYLASRD